MLLVFVVVILAANENSRGVAVLYPSAVWGASPIVYYEIEDPLGTTWHRANPLAPGDEFRQQFESLEDFSKWKGREAPPILAVDRRVGPDGGISEFTAPRSQEQVDLAKRVGHFNLRRAFTDFNVVSIENQILPYGMAWIEIDRIVNPIPLSMASVNSEAIFGPSDDESEDETEKSLIGKQASGDALDPENVVERLGLTGSPEPTVLAILGVVFMMMVVAVVRVNLR